VQDWSSVTLVTTARPKQSTNVSSACDVYFQRFMVRQCANVASVCPKVEPVGYNFGYSSSVVGIHLLPGSGGNLTAQAGIWHWRIYFKFALTTPLPYLSKPAQF
jgi:hypothetical protein